MSIDEINKEAYHLVDILKDNIVNYEPTPNFSGSQAQLEINKLDVIIDDYIAIKSKFQNGQEYIRAIQSFDKEYYFAKNDFIRFRTFLKNVYLNYFQQVCSLYNIENLTYRWIVNIKNTGKSSSDYYLYIQNQLDSTIKNYRFYYPVFNLHLENEFSIGNVQFSFFTKAKTEILHKNDNIKSDFYKKILGKVFVSTSIMAESSKAENLTFSVCCLAFDVLKLFICDFLSPSEKLLIDIEHRASFNFSDEYFNVINDDLKTLKYNFGAKNSPINLDSNQLLYFKRNGIEVFSSFIKSNIDTELKEIIVNAIKTFAIAISNNDIHLRISLIISMCEMLLLKEDEKNYTACLCQKRFLSITKRISLADKSKAEVILVDFYLIRNKYLHNGIRLPINLKDYTFFHKLVRVFLINIIELSSNNKDKNTFLDNYDFIAECKEVNKQKKTKVRN